MKIEAVSMKEVKTKRGMSPTYSFKGDDGQWYGCGFDNPEVARGDEVDFEMESTKYGNKVVFETFKVVKKINGTSTAEAGKPAVSAYPRKPYGSAPQMSRPFPIPLLHGDRAIVRQSALKAAVDLVRTGIILPGKDPIETTIQAARKFEAYSAGDIERMAAEDVHKETL